MSEPFFLKIKEGYNFIFENIRFALPHSDIIFDYVQLENFVYFSKNIQIVASYQFEIYFFITRSVILYLEVD